MYVLTEFDPAQSAPTYDALMSHYHPDDVPMHNAVVQKVVQDGLPYEFDIRTRETDGVFRWLHAKGRGEKDADGKVVRLFGTLMDITERKKAAEALRASESRLRDMVENFLAGAVFVDDERFLPNRAIEEVTGYSRAEMPTLAAWFAAIYRERAEAVHAFYLERKALGFPGAAIVPITRKDGTERQVELVAYGYPGGEIWMLRDMTEHWKRKEALRLSEERFRRAFDDAGIGMTLADAHGNWLKFNAAFTEIVGYSEAELMQGDYKMITHPDDIPPAKEWFAAVRGRGLRQPFRQEKRYFHKNGSVVWALTTISVTCDKNDVPLNFIGQVQDITARKYAERQLEANNLGLSEINERMEQHICTINEQTAELEYQKEELMQANLKLEALATTDGLTGLKNHRAFREKLSDEWSRSERFHAPFSIVLLDVDKFKTYNDAFGHPEGDRVLQTVAAIMQATARASDWVCRYGGEEFVILLPDADAESAMQAAERSRAAIENGPWTLRPVTASFGVATANSGIATPQELIDRADKAMYASKAGGRNRVTPARAPAFLSPPVPASA